MSSKRTKTPKLIDLFCGTGGFASGFTTADAGFEIAYAIDNDKAAVGTARANHRSVPIEEKDIRAVDLHLLRRDLGISDVDVIIGGPPCQGFSSLRPNRGADKEDERNSLFLEFARFVEEFRPKMIVLENVVGLLTHRDGATLEKTIEAFEGLGYSTDWRILNAASFGVPQKRERFILLGARDSGEIAWPEPTHRFSGKVIGHTDKARFLEAGEDAPEAVSVEEAIGDLPHLNRGEHKTQYEMSPYTQYQLDRRKASNELSLHKASNHSDKMMEVIKHAGDSIACIPPHLISSGFSSCYSRLRAEEPATTITVKFQSPASSKCIHPYQHRTITPREAARIQSFDDDFKFVGSLTQIASQLGNAVPPLLGKALAQTISKLI